MQPSLVFLCLVTVVAVSGTDLPCSFTKDCKQHATCQNIQDASCVCNFGQCIIHGNPFFRGKECDSYEDCNCRNDPKNCVCHNGFCREEAWECHEVSDCINMEKCRGKECACQGNKCEWDCDSDSDCEGFHCNRALGWKCECQKSLCEYVKKREECNNIVSCVRKGLCNNSEPCACTQGYCVDPSWVTNTGNCRNDKDCESSIVNCKGRKCDCADIKGSHDWNKMGTCKPKEESTQQLIFN